METYWKYCYLKDGHEALELSFIKLMNIHWGLDCTHQTISLFLQIKENAAISSLLYLSVHSKKNVINVLPSSPALLKPPYFISDFRFFSYFLNLHAKQHVPLCKKLEINLWKFAVSEGICSTVELIKSVEKNGAALQFIEWQCLQCEWFWLSEAILLCHFTGLLCPPPFPGR